MYQVTATNTQTPIKLESSKVNQNNVRKINFKANEDKFVRNQQVPEVENKQDNLYRVNFKAGEDSFDRQTRRQGPVYTQPAILNQADPLTIMMEDQQKKHKKQDFWNKFALFAGIGASLAIIASIFFLNRGGAKEQMKSLTGVDIKWKDFNGGKRNTAKLTDGTTHKNIKKQFEILKDNNALSEEAKNWAGITEQADVYYVYGYGGTGKTYCTEQLAEDMNALYACVKYPDLGSPYKDAASMKIAAFFDEILKMANKDPNRPIVVCIDESDALIQKVSEKALSDEAKKTRSAVITGIDNITKNAKNVKLFLTSNYHPESGIVDDVVLRRVNKKLRVDLPDYDQADALTKMYLSNIKAIPSTFYESNEYKEFIKKIISNEQELGYSGGEIANIASEAAKDFASTLKGIPNSELKNHPFQIKFLEDALNTVGAPAARTNTTMLTATERGTINF